MATIRPPASESECLLLNSDYSDPHKHTNFGNLAHLLVTVAASR